MVRRIRTTVILMTILQAESMNKAGERVREERERRREQLAEERRVRERRAGERR